MKKSTNTLKINEIYKSIQGESTHMGRPCIFVRLTYCNLRCTYCDTEYAFYEGNDFTIDEIMVKIKSLNCNLVEVTGGEPLFQDQCIELLKRLVNENYEVMLETGGSLPITEVPSSVIKIVDFKCPSSGMKKKNLWPIVDDIQPHDEIKFVIGNREDFDWACKKIYKYHLHETCTVLFSPVFGEIEPKTIVDWIIDENIPVRFQIQSHKYIWNPEEKSV
jgi:7-carboxy-7-deazaguanine synthase